MLLLVTLLCALGIGRESSPTRSTSCAAATTVASYFASLHSEDWRLVKPEVASKKAPMPLEQIVIGSTVEDPRSAPPCSGSVTMTNRDNSPECYLWVVFDETAPVPCGQILRSVAWRATLPLSDAMISSAEIQRVLKAGGKPTGTEWDSTYEWRSRDSKQVFELVVRIVAAQTALTPETKVELMVRLRHFDADPSDVDLLPFERGTFLRSKPRSKV